MDISALEAKFVRGESLEYDDIQALFEAVEALCAMVRSPQRTTGGTS
jgi:hypothetical protein